MKKINCLFIVASLFSFSVTNALSQQKSTALENQFRNVLTTRSHAGPQLRKKGKGSIDKLLLSQGSVSSVSLPQAQPGQQADIDVPTAVRLAIARARHLWGGNPSVGSVIPLGDGSGKLVAYDVDLDLSGGGWQPYETVASDWQRILREQASESRPNPSGKPSGSSLPLSNPTHAYASLTISATYESCPIEAARRGVSKFYSSAWIAKGIAASVLGNPSPSMKEVCYVTPFERSYRFESGGTTIVVGGQEPWEWYDGAEYSQAATMQSQAWRSDLDSLFRSQGLSLDKIADSIRLNNEKAVGRILNESMTPLTVKCIPGLELFEPFEWHYGCTPTAMAMVLNYWKYYGSYGRLNDYFFQESDGVQDDNDCHVAEAQRGLAQYMATGSDGETNPFNISGGMLNFLGSKGYNWILPGSINWTGFVGSWSWDEMVSDIDAGLPFVFSASAYPEANGGTVGHSVAAVGYDDGTGDLLVYTTWASDGRAIQRVNPDFGLAFYKFSSGVGPRPTGAALYNIKLIGPDGDQHFSGCYTSGGVPAGGSADITWNNFGHPGDHVSLYYSTNGGSSWIYIGNAPDNGSYRWSNIPHSVSTSGRVMIRQFSDATTLAASDGSFGNFAFLNNAICDITVQTNPPGLSIVADGVSYASPQIFHWMAGFDHTIGTITPQSQAGVSYIWTNWNTGYSMSQQVTVTGPATYTASFTPQKYWLSQTSGTTQYLFDVCFPDAQNGSAVGANGTILHTTNGGSTWTNQTSGTNYILSGVCFTDKDTGTVVGQTGTILRTTNGGSTWTLWGSGTSAALYSASFTDGSNGHAVGEGGTILWFHYQHLFGWLWAKQTSGTTMDLLGVSFTDANTGTAVGASGVILRTTNGGATWTQQTSGTKQTLNGVSFVDANTGTAVGYNGTILRTTNGGSTWTNQTFSTIGFSGVSFTDVNNGTIVGSGTILRTTNGGSTWSTQTFGTLDLSAVSFADAYNGTVVGTSGTILHTATGGVAAPPQVPVAIAAANVTESSFTARWNAAALASTYLLDVAADANFASMLPNFSNLDLGNVLTKEITGLKGGTTYFYRIRAHNSDGSSGSSNTITATTIPPAPVPTTATNISQTSFTANWNASVGATSYLLDVATDLTCQHKLNGYSNLSCQGALSRDVKGLTAATKYYYRLRASNAGGTSANSTVVASATLGTPITLAMTAGNAQSGAINTTLSNPFAVTVTDAGGNAGSGVGVSFALAAAPAGSTGQSLSSTTTITGSNGQASTLLRLGNKLGTYIVAATSSGLSGSPVIFTATATAGAAAAITSTSGNAQAANIGTALASPFVVSVTDAGGNPVSGALVIFAISSIPSNTTGQSLSTEFISTNGSGQASTLLTLGNIAGTYTVTASSGGLSGSPVIFTATALNPAPALSSLSVARAGKGSILNVKLNGTNFLGGVTTVNFGAGITVNSQNVISSSQIVANITIGTNAQTGTRDVTVTNAGPGGGTATLINGFTVDTSTPTYIETTYGAIPERNMLFDAFPNPFNPSTTIRFALSQASDVSVRILNTLGQTVAILVDSHKESGYHQVQWIASGIPSGVYFCRIQAGAFVETKKVMHVQ